jgi:hypothetical protein
LAMRDTTRYLLAACAPTLRAALPATPAATEGRLDFGASIFGVGDDHYRVDRVVAAIPLAMETGKASIRSEKRRTVELRFDRERSVLVLQGKGEPIAVPGLMLAAADATGRRAEVERMLGHTWFGDAEAARWRARAAQPFTHVEMAEAQKVLSASVETHLAAMEADLAAGRGSFDTLGWSVRDGLERLVGPFGETRDDVVKGIRRVAKARLKAHGARALPYLIAAGVETGVVPRGVPGGVSAAQVVESTLAEGVLGCAFGALTALEILLGPKGRLRAKATDLIDVLERDFDRIDDRLHLFAGHAVTTFASLATSPETRDAPALWRRTAAYALAGLRTRMFAGFRTELSRKFYDDAIQAFDRTYDIAAARDARWTPRWHGSFLSPVCLWGQWWRRLMAVVGAVTDPPTRARLDALAERAQAHIEASRQPLSIFLPGPLDGRREDPVVERLQVMARDAAQGATDKPRAVQWRSLANAAMISPPAPELMTIARELLRTSTLREWVDDDGEVLGELTGVANLIATVRDTETAQTLSRQLIAAASREGAWPVLQAAHTLIVLAGVHAEPGGYADALRESFEGLAFAVTDPVSANILAEVLVLMGGMEPRLVSVLARARRAAVLTPTAI